MHAHGRVCVCGVVWGMKSCLANVRWDKETDECGEACASLIKGRGPLLVRLITGRYIHTHVRPDPAAQIVSCSSSFRSALHLIA